MRTSERLMWVFAAMVLICGAPLFFIDESDRESGRMWAGLAALCLAGFAFSLARNAWETGAIKLREFNYTRKDQPRRFLATVVMILVAGCGTLAAALRVLFFK